MGRVLLVVLVAVIALAGLGVAWLALLPPSPATQRIERTVPIDRAAPAR
jgi:hypothetical protein